MDHSRKPEPASPRDQFPYNGFALGGLAAGILATGFALVSYLRYLGLLWAFIAAVSSIIGMVSTRTKDATQRGFELALLGSFFALLAVISALFLTPPVHTQPDTPPDTITQAPEKSPIPPQPTPDVVDQPDLIIESLDLSPILLDAEGNSAVVVSLTVTNHSERSQNPLFADLNARQGETALTRTAFVNEESSGYDPSSLFTEIAPGQTHTLTYGYALIDDETPVQIETGANNALVSITVLKQDFTLNK